MFSVYVLSRLADYKETYKSLCGSVYNPREKFESSGFTVKTHKMFPFAPRLKNFKAHQQSGNFEFEYRNVIIFNKGETPFLK